MAAKMQHILYQNAAQSIVLIDLPASIAAAQGTKDCPSQATLLSVSPAEKSFVIETEPKSDKAKAAMADKVVEAKLADQHEANIRTALAEIRSARQGSWCLPRLIYEPPEIKKRTIEDFNNTDSQASLADDEEDKMDIDESKADTLTAILDKLGDSNTSSQFQQRVRDRNTGLLLKTHSRPDTEKDLEFNVKWDSWYPINHNKSDSPALLEVKKTEDPSNEIHRFILPPHSSFRLSQVWVQTELRGGIENTANQFSTPRTFPLILLDPPWPNRSAKRKHNYTTWTIKYTRRILLGMNLKQLILPNGIVAIWITNNTQIRNLVLGPGGLFERWNVSFFEEWLWIKTTATGEPISTLDSAFRKPYESLLLARAPPHLAMTAEPVEFIGTKVIAGVPDLHSRKPCLKSLFAPLFHLQQDDDYPALEVFARYCVAGWFSWGNEALMYNAERFWAR